MTIQRGASVRDLPVDRLLAKLFERRVDLGVGFGVEEALAFSVAFPKLPVSGTVSNFTPQKNLLSASSSVPGSPVNFGDAVFFTAPRVALNLSGTGGTIE